MSSTNSENPDSGVFEQIFIAIIVLSSILVIICIIRWFLQRNTSGVSTLLEKHNIRGLDSAAIAALPTFPYERYGNSNNRDEEDNKTSECSICLSAFEEGEMVKILPECMHSFHDDCVSLWLSGHMTCPVCRVEVLGSTTVDLTSVDLVVVPVLDLESRETAMILLERRNVHNDCDCKIDFASTA